MKNKQATPIKTIQRRQMSLAVAGAILFVVVMYALTILLFWLPDGFYGAL